MPKTGSSSDFMKFAAEEAVGPPLIGALLRMPWEAVQRHMLERLHERGFDDFDAAYLNVFQYPGPQGVRPTELAAQLTVMGTGPEAVNETKFKTGAARQTLPKTNAVPRHRSE